MFDYYSNVLHSIIYKRIYNEHEMQPLNEWFPTMDTDRLYRSHPKLLDDSKRSILLVSSWWSRGHGTNDTRGIATWSEVEGDELDPDPLVDESPLLLGNTGVILCTSDEQLVWGHIILCWQSMVIPRLHKSFKSWIYTWNINNTY